MPTYKITFRNPETGRRKSFVVSAPGICPAIDKACIKAMLFGWDIYAVRRVDTNEV